MRYAPLGELKVYEISEAELEKLEAGRPGQLHLNFALAMLPAAITVLIALQTTTISSISVYVAYQVAFWALGIQGLISLARWWLTSRSYDDFIRTIRNRMPTAPVIAEQAPPVPLVIEHEKVPSERKATNDSG